ncbi:myocardin isoform X3 [Silurus meridionalis]|uniref:myocardin isoform X3 n=1 Tax=Silurus meridionalis TaxID=175797 RepID=UPI001EEA44D5|nr:myocardin isoform X3 [Silurus meridionalis]
MNAVKSTEPRLGQSRSSTEPGFRNIGNPIANTQCGSRNTSNCKTSTLSSRSTLNPNNSTNPSSRLLGKSNSSAQRGSKHMGSNCNTNTERGSRNTGSQNSGAERGSKSILNPNPSAEKSSTSVGNSTRQVGPKASVQAQNNNVLQLRLQQRRTREQLADQGIMPPLKSPAAFHEQRKSLERSKTGDYLKHKIRSRPEKSELVNMHILQDMASESPAQDSQSKLKRARLADNLNEKIALRPGPLELVEKNIIPVDSTVKEAALKVNHGKFPKQEDSYAFEEDSNSESLSPEQPLSDESQSSAGPLAESKASSGIPSPSLTTGPTQGSQTRESTVQNKEEGLPVANNQTAPPIPVPAIIKSKTTDKNRNKKPKDVKPKVKKLKYHQYIPPDQKAEKSPPPMDSAYARLLQQQQLFLQLQILSQQKHQQQNHSHQSQCPQSQSFSYQPVHQHLSTKQTGEQQTQCSSSGANSTDSISSSSPVKTTYCSTSNITSVRPGPLPSNLDDLKVSELRQQLRIRGLPVSGTKTALIERLRPYKDSTSASPSSSGDITTVTFPVTPTGSLSSYQSPSSSGTLSHVGGYYPFCSNTSTPPISPASSDLSVSGSLPDSFSDVTMSSPQFGLQPSPAQLSAEDNPNLGNCLHGESGLDTEKDKMLVEKQKVIEELTWKLHQEQRQVEELRMQLHKRKHSHGLQEPIHLQPPSQMQHFFGVSIKQEHVASSCPMASKQPKNGPSNSCMEPMGHCSLGGGLQNLDIPSSRSPSGLPSYLSPQCSPQDSPVTKNSSSPQPNSIPSSPSNPFLLTPPLGRDSCPHNGARSHPMQLQRKNVAQSVSCTYSADQRSLQQVYSSNENNLNPRGSSKGKTPNIQQKMAILHSPRHIDQTCATSTTTFCSSDSTASAIKQPPCYEDAVKQQMTRSQQMDELLDVLIESGEIPANAKEERSPVTKVVPHLTVSASNTATSATPIPKFHRHFSHLPPSDVQYGHATGHTECHLEVLLSPLIRHGDIMPVKLSTEEGQLEKIGDSFAGHHHDDKLLSNRDMMGTPLSPMATKVSPVPTDNQGLGMTFSESPWESMEWLDLTPPSSATAFSSSMAPSAPSIFNTEFLDVSDIGLNSAMDLHLEHW